jgi:hypothetical protein
VLSISGLWKEVMLQETETQLVKMIDGTSSTQNQNFEVAI